MLIQKAFRNANALRISVPKPIQDALQLKPGHHVIFDHVAPGVVTIRNCTAIVNAIDNKEPRS